MHVTWRTRGKCLNPEWTSITPKDEIIELLKKRKEAAEELLQADCKVSDFLEEHHLTYLEYDYPDYFNLGIMTITEPYVACKEAVKIIEKEL